MNDLTEAQYRRECRKLVFAEKALPKRIKSIKDYIPYKAGLRVFNQDDWNLGRCIKCPRCDFVHLVYHFSFSASNCPKCGEKIPKEKYLFEVRNFKSYNQFFKKD